MSPDLGLVACLLALGVEPSTPEKYLLHTIESVQDVPVEEYVWSFDAAAVEIDGEELTSDDVAARFNDAEWLHENAEHPIAKFKHYWNILSTLRDSLRAMKPLLKMTRRIEGDGEIITKRALIPQDATPEERAEILEAFEGDGDE